MITLKLNAYNKRELLALSDKLEQISPQGTDFCRMTRCEECVFRHLCADISSCQQYVSGFIAGGDKA